MKNVLRILLILPCAVALLIVVCDLRVRNMARGRLYDDVQALPHEHAALLLGTSARLRGGSPNPFFEYRMDAAAALFRAGKVDCISISLNTDDPAEYLSLCRPKFGEAAYPAMLKFAEEAAANVSSVVMTVVGEPVTSIEKQARCRAIAESLGATLRVRPYEPAI